MVFALRNVFVFGSCCSAYLVAYCYKETSRFSFNYWIQWQSKRVEVLIRDEDNNAEWMCAFINQAVVWEQGLLIINKLLKQLNMTMVVDVGSLRRQKTSFLLFACLSLLIYAYARSIFRSCNPLKVSSIKYKNTNYLFNFILYNYIYCC